MYGPYMTYDSYNMIYNILYIPTFQLRFDNYLKNELWKLELPLEHMFTPIRNKFFDEIFDSKSDVSNEIRFELLLCFFRHGKVIPFKLEL